MRLTDISALGPRLEALSRRRGWAVAVSLSLFGLILWKIHPDRLGRVLLEIRWLPALGAVGCILLSAALLGLRWQWMLRLQDMERGYGESWRGVMVGNALSAALLGALFGDIAKSAWYARRHDLPFPAVLLSCGLDRLCGGLGLALYALLSVLSAFREGVQIPSAWNLNPRVLQWTPWVMMILLPLGLILWRKLRRGALDPQGKAWLQWVESWKALRARPGLCLGAVGISLIANMLIGATLGFALASVGPGSLPWMKLLWTFPAIGLAASLPLTFAGAGAREGAAIAIWSTLGIPAPVAVAASLVTLVATLLGAVPGSLLFLQGRNKAVTDNKP